MYEETFRIAFISASIPAAVSIMSIFINVLLNHKKDEKIIIYKNKLEVREKLKNNLAKYMSKIQQCIHDYEKFVAKTNENNFNSIFLHISEAIDYGYIIKLELNPVNDKNIFNAISEANEKLASKDKNNINSIDLKGLYNLSYVTLITMNSELKKAC